MEILYVEERPEFLDVTLADFQSTYNHIAVDLLKPFLSGFQKKISFY